ncbi:MAG: hypothetical protein HFJ09_12230 [Lachnospiraceae bacterium]|nr:hypothetical protein [Lachnospiraceae bacterium]
MLTRRMLWRNCYIPFFDNVPFQIGFQEMKDEVQNIIKENSALQSKIRAASPVISFVSNLLLLGQCLNVFDFLVIDMLWWRKSKRIRFTGTEDKKELYANPRKHFISFLKGIVVFLLVAVIDGVILSVF